MLGVVPRRASSDLLKSFGCGMGQSIACGCIQRRLPLAPYYLGRAAIGRTPKNSNRPIGSINVGQKIVID
jgi:hypothetical protein